MKRPLAAMLACLVVLAGCSGDGKPKGKKLPEGKELLGKSADAMSKVSTVSFTLKVEGPISVLQITDATGVITSAGSAKATAHLNQGGRVVEYEYVQVDQKPYLKGPTGGWQPVPEAIAARFFNPTALLTGEKSLSKGLAQSTNAKTAAEEKVDGVDAYRVTATVETSRIAGLSLLASGSVDDAQLSIAKDTDYLVKAVLPFKVPGEKDQTVVTVTFSDFNENVEITAPV